MAYRGYTFPMPIGIDGWSGNKNQTQIKPTQLIQAQDITYEYGTIGKEGGCALYSSPAIVGAPAIRAGISFRYLPNVQAITVFCDDGKVYRGSGASFTIIIRSGLNAPIMAPQFVTGGKETQAAWEKLFLFSDTNMPQVLIANLPTMADIANPAADWSIFKPVCGCIHNNRMWAGAGHFAYYSDPSDHENFTTGGPTVTGQIAVYPGVGDQIVHLESFKGMLLVIKKPYGIFLVDTSNPDITQWVVGKVSEKVGAAGPGCVVPTDNDVLVMDPAGSINQISAVTQELPIGTFAASSITFAATMDPFIRDNFNFAKLHTVQSVYYPIKREVHFCVPRTGSNLPNARFVVDYNRPDIARFRWSIRDICPAIWPYVDSDQVSRLMIGDTTGNIWRLDLPQRSKGTSGYYSVFQTGHEDFSAMFIGAPSVQKLAGANKNFQFLELVSDPRGNWNLSVDVFLDTEFQQTVQFNMGVTGVPLDVFTLDRDPLAGDALRRKRKRITGEGRRISLAGYTSDRGQDFSVEKFLVEFTVGKE